ncbi:MAG: hypothetical protein PVF83_09430 [Anaerolineales bacterium]|jgi:hypothetical protein
MAKLNYFILIGAVLTTLIAILHIILVFKPALFRYISGGVESDLADMAIGGSNQTRLMTIGLAVIFAVWAIYGFSGAGLIGQLPLLRAGLILIGVIYVLRALAMPTEINMVMNQGYPVQFVVFSAISLVTGLFYLVGTFT